MKRGQCNVTQALLGCFLNRNVQCLNKESCSVAGQCSDRNLLVNLDASPPIFGACVSPRLLPVGDYQGTTTLPFCLPQSRSRDLYKFTIYSYLVSQWVYK